MKNETAQEVNPSWLLAAIVAVCIGTLIVCVILDVTGNQDQVPVVMTFVVPIASGLIAWKIDLNRRISQAGQQIIESKVNGQRERIEALEKKVK